MPYLTPDEIPEDDDCRPLFIPASPEWLAIVSGALTELTQKWNWAQLGAVTVDEAVARMQVMVDEYYGEVCSDCELPEGGKIIRLSDEFVVEELIDGEWGAPSEDYTIAPPPARTDPTSEQMICLAAKNLNNILASAYEEITDSFTTGLTVIQALAALGGFLVLAVTAPLGLVVASLGIIAIGSWKIGYNIVEFVTSDFWDEAFTDNFTCALIRCASETDGIVTFDFDCINQELINQIEWLDPTISSYTLAAQVRWLIAQFGADGLNAAGGTTNITDDDCSFCGESWCAFFPLGEGSQCGLVIDVIDGTLVSGMGIRSLDTGTQQLLHVTMTMPDAVLTSAELVYTTAADGNGGTRAWNINDGVTILRSITLNAGTVTDFGNFQGAIDVNVDNFAYALDTNNPSGYNYLVSLKLRGEGVYPFSGCECDE